MAIQNRRGDYKDFDPNQMVPGEFAVSNSEGNKRLFLCFARPGDVIEIPTVESIVDTHEVEEIRDEALEAKDQAVEAAEIAKYNTFTSISATVNNSVGTPSVSVVKLSEAPNNSFRFDFRNLRGAQGIQGKQGVSVVDSYIDDNNHLIIVYSDSTQANPHTDDAGNIGLNVVPLTKAQYDALSDAEKMDPEIFYWIKDMNGGTYGMVIGGGTSNYNELKNKPSINGVTLQGAINSSTLHIGGEIASTGTVVQFKQYSTNSNVSTDFPENSSATLQEGAERFNDYRHRTGTSGDGTLAIGRHSHAEGNCNLAYGEKSHVEGENCVTGGQRSHAEGFNTYAKGDDSHAEGLTTTASGDDSHAEGITTTASGICSHAEGCGTEASGSYSHASGYYTKATQNNQTAIGKYNAENIDALFIVGKGTGNSARSNAFEIYARKFFRMETYNIVVLDGTSTGINVVTGAVFTNTVTLSNMTAFQAVAIMSVDPSTVGLTTRAFKLQPTDPGSDVPYTGMSIMASVMARTNFYCDSKEYLKVSVLFLG